MEYVVSVAGRDVVFTSRLSRIRELNDERKPCVLILCEENRCEDTFLAKFAVDDSDMWFSDVSDMCIRPKDDSGVCCSDENLEFLRRVIARCDGTPLRVFETQRLVVRELCANDCEQVAMIYEDAGGFIEPFWGDSDIADCLGDYAQRVYDIRGYGMWGVSLKPHSHTDGLHSRIVGLIGLTDGSVDMLQIGEEDNNSLELGFAFLKNVRGHGYALEACEGAVEYARTHFGFREVFMRTAADNDAAIRLGKKLEKSVGIGVVIL